MGKPTELVNYNHNIKEWTSHIRKHIRLLLSNQETISRQTHTMIHE